jgi:hypothetical protein
MKINWHLYIYNIGDKRTIAEYSDINTDSQIKYSSPKNLPKKTIVEKRSKVGSGHGTREKMIKFRSDLQKKNVDNKLRRSLKENTRDKRLQALDPLIKRKEKHFSGFVNKKNSMKVEKLNHTNPSSILGSRTGKNRDLMLNSKLDKSGNISSGYGEILKLIKKKKARIQSAHPIMKQNQSLRKINR